MFHETASKLFSHNVTTVRTFFSDRVLRSCSGWFRKTNGSSKTITFDRIKIFEIFPFEISCWKNTSIRLVFYRTYSSIRDYSIIITGPILNNLLVKGQMFGIRFKAHDNGRLNGFADSQRDSIPFSSFFGLFLPISWIKRLNDYKFLCVLREIQKYKDILNQIPLSRSKVGLL